MGGQGRMEAKQKGDRASGHKRDYLHWLESPAPWPLRISSVRNGHSLLLVGLGPQEEVFQVPPPLFPSQVACDFSQVNARSCAPLPACSQAQSWGDGRGRWSSLGESPLWDLSLLEQWQVSSSQNCKVSCDVSSRILQMKHLRCKQRCHLASHRPGVVCG